MNVRKNITLIISKFPPEYSGPGVRIPRLYKWLKTQNHALHLNVICGGTELTKNENYTHDDIPVRRITASGLRRILNCLPKRLYESIIYQCEFVKAFLYFSFSGALKDKDMLHIAGHSGLTAAAILYANITKTPIMMELVTEHARHKQKILYVFTVQPHKNSVIIALTQKTEAACLAMGLDKNRLWQRPNPIDIKKFAPALDQKQQLRTTLTPFNHDHIIISNVAKMMPQKNQRFLIDVMSHLPERYVCVLAGPLINEGPLQDRDQKYMDDVYATIKHHNLQDRIHIVADFVQADQYMQLSDIYAMPAWNEGFGTPMIEAMGCGIPVIANADEYAFQEWINDGENGYLCDIQSPMQWANAIEKVCKFNSSQCLQISENIHKKAGQEAIYSHYEKHIQHLTRSR